MYRDATNVEHEMYDDTSNNWFQEKFGSHTRKTFSRFTTKGSCTRNITHNMGSTAV